MCRTTMLGARLGSWLLLTALALGVAQAATPGEIDAAKLKPEVLYIDLGNPSSARGIAPANEKEEANLERREVGAPPAAEPKNGAVILKMDPAVVKEETPLLVAFSYYDADRWDEPLIQGFLHAPDRHGFYTGTPTTAGAYSETWRWWTTFTYANYRGYVRDGVQANFRLKVKSIRWVLVLPLQDASIKQMNGIREKALGMLGEYSRLLVAEAALQESRNRLEQGMKYVQSGGQVPPGVSALFAETKAGAGQARVEMNRVILEVLEVLDPAYLGLFDGQDTERLSALDAFALKARTLAGQYRALTARTEKGIAGQIAAQSATPSQEGGPAGARQACPEPGGYPQGDPEPPLSRPGRTDTAAHASPGQSRLPHQRAGHRQRLRLFAGQLGQTAGGRHLRLLRPGSRPRPGARAARGTRDAQHPLGGLGAEEVPRGGGEERDGGLPLRRHSAQGGRRQLGWLPGMERQRLQFLPGGLCRVVTVAPALLARFPSRRGQALSRQPADPPVRAQLGGIGHVRRRTGAPLGFCPPLLPRAPQEDVR